MKNVIWSIILAGLILLAGCSGNSKNSPAGIDQISSADENLKSTLTKTVMEAANTLQSNKDSIEKSSPYGKVTPQATQPVQKAERSISSAAVSPGNSPKAIKPSPLPILEPSPKALKYSYNIENFGFILNYGVLGKNSLNIFENKYTKDLISNGSITVDFTLTQDEILYIFQEMKRINILDYPTMFYPPDNDNQPGIHRTVKPHQSYYFKMRFGSMEKEITWIDSNRSESQKAILLRELINKIIKVIMDKDEYKNLPKAAGGYS